MSYPNIIARLQKGEEVTLKACGSSMEPRIKNKSRYTLAPVNPDDVKVGDVVLAKVSGRHYVHLVTAIDGKRYQISNNKGHVNGWTYRDKIYGRVKEL
jgi:phage repressor protein C with HTH and peptisase S24 domain